MYPVSKARVRRIRLALLLGALALFALLYAPQPVLPQLADSFALSPATAALLTQYKDFGASNRAGLDRAMAWFDRELSDGRAFIMRDTFTMADIAAVTIIDFAALIGMAPLTDRAHVQAWHDRIAARPSYGA